MKVLIIDQPHLHLSMITTDSIMPILKTEKEKKEIAIEQMPIDQEMIDKLCKTVTEFIR